MGTLQLYIHGIGLGRLDRVNGVWDAYFPKVTDHDFQMVVRVRDTHGGSVKVTTYAPTPGKRIEIKAKGTNGGSSKGNMANSLDLTRLIGKPQGDLNYPIGLVSTPSRYSAFAALHGFRLEQAAFDIVPPNMSILPMPNRYHDYHVHENDEVGSPLGDIRIKESMASTEMNMGAHDFTIITIDGAEVARLQHAPTLKYTIILRNHCEKTPQECFPATDFKHLYNIFEPATVNRKALVMFDGTISGHRTGCDFALLEP